MVKESWNLYHMVSVMESKGGVDSAVNMLQT